MGYDGPAGRLELTWTNKHLRLIDRPDGRIRSCPPDEHHR